jgi:hypothetical protein
MTLAPARLVALGREPALELHHDAVDGGQVLRRAGRERAVELVQRPRRRERLSAFDLRALELAPQMRLEAADLIARQREFLRRPLALDQAAGLGLQPERPPDPLDVDPEYAGALAAAAERGDREPREVAQGRLVAVADRLQDLLAQRVEVDPVAAGDPVLLRGVAALAHPGLERGALGGAEEVAIEDQVEHAAVVGRLGQRGRERLPERPGPGPLDLPERGERVIELRRPERHAFGAQRVRKADQMLVKRQAARPRVRRPCRDRCGA